MKAQRLPAQLALLIACLAQAAHAAHAAPAQRKPASAQPAAEAKPAAAKAPEREEVTGEEATLQDSKERNRAAAEEMNDRMVDSAANDAQRIAIQKLKAQLSRKDSPVQEPVLLVRLADLQYKEAQTLFRVIQGGFDKKRGPNEERYQQALRDVIATLNRYITKYPANRDAERMFLLRAKAYRELGDSKTAAAMFTEFVTRYPKAKDVPLAYIYASEMAVEAQNYPLAIAHLNKAKEYSKQDPAQYSYVLDKLAQAHYETGDLPNAMRYLEARLIYETAGIKGRKPRPSEVERVLVNMAYYYATAMEKKVPGYTIEAAYPFFQKHNPGPHTGKLLASFALALRAKALENELMRWREVIVTYGKDYPESFGALYTVYEAVIFWKRHPMLLGLPRDLNVIKSKKSSWAADAAYPKFRKLLVETMERFHQYLEKPNVAESDRAALSSALTAVYSAFLQVVPSEDDLRPKVIFRLAEHFFKVREFDKATTYYTWISEGREKLADADLIKQAKLRAIAARYEVLRVSKVVPEDLTAKSMKGVEPQKLSPEFTTWIGWIDQYPNPGEEGLDNFEFEANRAFYSQGHVKGSIERLIKFVEKRPKSKFVIPSASLVVDTYVLSQDWEALHETSTKFLAMKTWQSPEFVTKLSELASDSYFKIVETNFKEKNNEVAFNKSQEYMTMYPKGKHYMKAVGIAGASALALDKKEQAISFFSTIIDKAPDSEYFGTALFVRASESERKRDFAAASQDYTRLLAMPNHSHHLESAKVSEMKRKVLLLALLAEAPNELKNTLAKPIVCSRDLKNECEKYEALLTLLSTSGTLDRERARGFVKRAKNAPKEASLIWTTIALKGAPNLWEAERKGLVKIVTTRLNDEDPLVKFALIESLTQSVPEVFKLARQELKTAERLPRNPEEAAPAIKKRVRAIQKIEAWAASAVQLPWARVRASILNETSGLYLDLASEIKKMRIPGGISADDRAAYQEILTKLSLPFEEKGQEIRGKAFEMAQAQAIEPKVMGPITDAYLKDHASQAAELKPEGPPITAYRLSPELLQTVDPAGGWDKNFEGMTDDGAMIKGRWLRAVTQRHWPRVAFYVQQAQDAEGISKAVARVMKAVSLAAVGAVAEGVAEMEGAAPELLGQNRHRGYLVLVSHYFGALNKEKTRKWIGELVRDNVQRELWLSESATPALVFAAAARWTGFELDQSVKEKFRETVASDDQTSTQPWGRFVLSPEPEPTRAVANEAPAAAPQAAPAAPGSSAAAPATKESP
jgi:tetratricopeptide (TPR) repeat protein